MYVIADLIIINLDWTRPWTFHETLRKWLSFIRKSHLVVDNKDKQINRKYYGYDLYYIIVIVEGYLQSAYAEQHGLSGGSSELTEGCLLENIGIPLVVVCSKVTN